MKRNKKEALARRLKTTALAAGAAMAAAAPGGAAIITGGINQAVKDGDEPFFVDLDKDGTDDFQFNAFSSSAYVTAQGNNGIYGSTDGFSSYTYAQAFIGSQSVGGGGGSTYSSAVLTSSSGSFGNFADSTPRYLGLRFNATGGNASGFVYGWVRVAVPSPGEIQLYNYAYEDSGAPIHVPNEVPEPSTLLLMASGAAGLLALRRRRKS